MRTFSRRASLAGFLSLGAAPVFAQRAPLPLPKVEGPIPETAASRAYRSSGGDDEGMVAAAGYTRSEYVVSGNTSKGPYRTRILLTRPKEAGKFSGVLLTEIYQTSVWSQVRAEIMRRGHAWVMISSRGNQWLPMLKRGSPGRYDDFVLPADEVNPEILARVIAMFRSAAAPSPAPDLKVRKAILMGYSGDGASTRMFIETAHDTVRLADGKPVFDGFFVCGTAVGSAPRPIADIDVPVLEIMNENEMIRSFERGSMNLAYRRPDGPNYRLWEIAGTGHISTRQMTVETVRTYGAACVETPYSDIAMDHIYSNALHRLVEWVDRRTSPPTADRIVFEADGRTIARDQHGNTRGGVRSTALDVPKAMINVVATERHGGPGGVRCEMVAWMKPFPAEKMTALYRTPAGYAAAVGRRVDELASQRWYLAEDAAALKQEAARVRW